MICCVVVGVRKRLRIRLGRVFVVCCADTICLDLVCEEFALT
jgi:hypothetical protein